MESCSKLEETTVSSTTSEYQTISDSGAAQDDAGDGTDTQNSTMCKAPIKSVSWTDLSALYSGPAAQMFTQFT